MAVIIRNTQALLRNWLENNIFPYTGAGAPPATLTGVAGPGSVYTDVTNKERYVNIGTLAAPVWARPNNRYLSGSISAADIISVAAGKFGHANGVEIIPAPGAGN